MRNTLVKTLTEEALKDNTIMLLTGDLGFNVLNKFYDVLPQQYVNAGISEQNMTSVAAGLALSGKKVFTYSIGNFSTLRCFEQIRNDICYHNANVKVVSLAAGFAYGPLGMSHHATEDIACMRSLPNMRVFSPADPLETIAVTKAAITSDGPCYIRLGKGGEPNLREAFDIENFEVGKAYQLRDGKANVCIFSTGSVTKEAILAAEQLKDRGSIPVYTFPTVKPIDEEFIRACAERYDAILTLEEHNIVGGLGGAVAEVLAENPSRARLIRLGLRDVFSSVVGDVAYLRHYYKIDAEAVVTALEKVLK